MSASYNPDHQGMREFLNSPGMMHLVVRVAERIMTRAISLSPVETGEYISHWRLRSHRFGGIHNDRCEAIVFNDARDAIWVEYGHPGREPYYVLTRASREAGW